MAQWRRAGFAATGALVSVPPGESYLVLVNAHATQTLYVGGSAVATAAGSAVTAGAPIPALQQVTLQGYPGSTGTTLYGIGGTTITVGVLLSTPQ